MAELKPSAAAWVPSGQQQQQQQQEQQQASSALRRAPAQQQKQQLQASKLQQHAQQAEQLQEAGGSYGSYDLGGGGFGQAYLEAERLTCKACEPLPPRRTFTASQLPQDLRAYFAHSLRLTMDHLPLDDPRNKEVPKWFNMVSPLDHAGKKRGAAGASGYPTSMFKVMNRKDGFVYALRRIDNVRAIQAIQQNCDVALQLWKQVQHPNVVPLRQAFVHQRAVFLVHDYWPGAQTLHDYILGRGMGDLLPEKILWSIATQLLLALRAAHNHQLSFRGGVSLNHVLLTGRNRVRVGSVGLMHVLEGQSKPGSETAEMADDVLCLAKALLALCCMSTDVEKNWSDSLAFVGAQYSKELASLVALPFQRPGTTVYDLLSLHSRGLLAELDELYSHSDAMEDHLCKQLETGRLNRLMIKLNLVNERPEYGKTETTSWAETGDRYLLKLFRDYVFHQTDDQGQPWLDMGHIITSLNKLDIRSMERILLTSRDGRSILVVSFADVAKCLDDAFHELLNGHQSSQYYQQKRANPNAGRVIPAHLNPTVPLHAQQHMSHHMASVAQQQQQYAPSQMDPYYNPYGGY